MEHSDVRGDMPRPLPGILELEKAIVVYGRTETPFWDFDVRDLFFLFQIFTFSSPCYVVHYSSWKVKTFFPFL